MYLADNFIGCEKVSIKGLQSEDSILLLAVWKVIDDLKWVLQAVVKLTFAVKAPVMSVSLLDVFLFEEAFKEYIRTALNVHSLDLFSF